MGQNLVKVTEEKEIKSIAQFCYSPSRKGIDIRYIKDIPGHFSIKTTERYTYVSKEKLIQISSPLDDLWLKGEIM